MKKFSLNQLIVLWIGLLMLGSCSTQKNTLVNRNFHSITTKYNGFFNARESYREGLRRLEQSHEDNYEEVLSVFRYGSPQSRAGVSGQMEVAYQKASTAIRRHSMNIKGVEYNRWIDDCYFLIARSHYFKGDHELSVLIFEYIIRQFESPLVYLSKIWVAKNQLERNQFAEALQTLERSNRDRDEGKLDKTAMYLFHAVYADYYLRQQHYPPAIAHLQDAIRLSPNARIRTRLTFISAQAYQQAGDLASAQQTYARVLKMNPGFDMAFQTRINMATAFDARVGNSAFVEAELKKMLRDNKNREFKDRIYYALGQMALVQNKQEDARAYFLQATRETRGSNHPKGLSYLQLGQMALKDKDYVQASNFYDSTMVYLSREYTDYTQVTNKKTILNALASMVSIVSMEDSLQQLARMSPAERNIVVDQIIAQVQEQERLESEKEQERLRMRQQMVRGGAAPVSAADGSWYFYNPSAMSFGKTEFYARWGERKLDDLWRISNKQVLAFGETPGPMASQDNNQGNSRLNRAALLENIPTSPEKMSLSHQRIDKALFDQGVLFKEQLADPREAIARFEELIRRYPQSDNALLASYFLYTLYGQQQNTVRANFYKERIIANYPESDFARILKDPNYARELERRQDLAKASYQQAWDYFQKGQYAQVVELSRNLEALELSREQEAQYAYLGALAMGKISGDAVLIEQLSLLIAKYPGTAVYPPAETLLASLKRQNGPVAQTATMPLSRPENALEDFSSVFHYNPATVHFFVILVQVRDIQIRQLRNQINVFNREHFGDSNLSISNLFFDDQRQLVTVTNFANAAKALEYMNRLLSDTSLEAFPANAMQGFAISVDNYPVFYQERRADEYLRFFRQNYVKP